MRSFLFASNFNKSHLLSLLFRIFNRWDVSLSLNLHLVVVGKIYFFGPFIFVVMTCQLKNPLWKNLTSIVNKIPLRSLNDLMIYDPFRKSDAYYRAWMDLKPIIWSDVKVCTVPLKLSNVCEISTKNATQNRLVHVWWRFNFVNFPFLPLLVLEFHEFRLRRKSIKCFDLIFQLVVNFDCILHYVVTKFHFTAYFLLLVMLSIHKSEKNVD
jgi:hypothetical protein